MFTPRSGSLPRTTFRRLTLVIAVTLVVAAFAPLTWAAPSPTAVPRVPTATNRPPTVARSTFTPEPIVNPSGMARDAGSSMGADAPRATMPPTVGSATQSRPLVMASAPSGIIAPSAAALVPAPTLPAPVAMNAMMPAAGVTNTMCAPLTSGNAFATPAFQAQWQQGEGLTPNFWGPAGTGGLTEQYADASNGQRLVQYFDKGRMELAGDTVTNGLLATELVTGRMQMGDSTFVTLPPPAIAIAGDPDPRNPTYADVTSKAATLFMPTPANTGGDTRVLFSKESGLFPANVSYVMEPRAGFFSAYDDATQHNVMDVFADYRTRVGVQTVGLAISEPFGVSVIVGGEQTVVLMQVFERRVLTYKRTNPDPYKVEMGNIGQHYYQWRYCTGA